MHPILNALPERLQNTVTALAFSASSRPDKEHAKERFNAVKEEVRQSIEFALENTTENFELGRDSTLRQGLEEYVSGNIRSRKTNAFRYDRDTYILVERVQMKNGTEIIMYIDPKNPMHAAFTIDHPENNKLMLQFFFIEKSYGYSTAKNPLGILFPCPELLNWNVNNSGFSFRNAEAGTSWEQQFKPLPELKASGSTIYACCIDVNAYRAGAEYPPVI